MEYEMVCSVSYTHLDVYKRQSGSMPMRTSAHLVLVTALLLGLRQLRAGMEVVNEIAMY